MLGEWKKSFATIPSHLDISTSNAKKSCNLSSHSVGKAVLDLGRIESFINDKFQNSKLSHKHKCKDELVLFNNVDPSAAGNSILLQILMASNDLNLEMISSDDLGVSIFFISSSSKLTVLIISYEQPCSNMLKSDVFFFITDCDTKH